MTGPHPKLNNGRISLEYICGSGKKHRCNLDVTLANPGGSPSELVANLGTTPVLFTDAVDMFVLLAKALMGTDATFQTAYTYHVSGGAFIQDDIYSVGVVGTAAGLSTAAGEYTLVFRDSDHNLDKIVLLETHFSGVDRNAFGGMSVAEQALVTDVLDVTTGHIGNWYQSKEAHIIWTFIARTKSYNKKLRRQEGLG